MRGYSYLLVGLALSMLVGESTLILIRTAGHFTYTLDDPYISLAVAENLARFGHYGINLGESSSPCSSILYPLVLAPFCLWRPLAPWGPLILDLPCAIVSVVVIREMIRDALCLHGARPQFETEVAAPLLLFTMFNGFAVVFTGLEHSIQILVALLTMFLLSRVWRRYEASPAAETQITPGEARLLFLCIWLGPLIRFELLTTSALAIGLLIVVGHRRLAASGAVAVTGSLGLYFGCMHALGLPPLPSSVLVKSHVMADALSSASFVHRLATMAAAIDDNFWRNVADPEAGLLIAFWVLLAISLWASARRRPDSRQLYVLGVLVAVVLHFQFGRFGWYGRYEDYIYGVAFAALIHAYGSQASAKAGPRLPASITRQRVLLILATAGVLVNHRISLWPLITTPQAAENIYLQQYQMHRFAADYWRNAVAVNDIGYVSFENPHFVLDLWGLGSEEARKLESTDAPDSLALLTRRYRVGLAMIYPSWFGSRHPVSWKRVAILSLKMRRITAAESQVSFYLTGAQRYSCVAVRSELKNFSLSLPPRSRLTVLLSCGSATVSSGGRSAPESAG